MNKIEPIIEKPTDLILVDQGVMFEGTRDNFRDCFFDNAQNEQIIPWCQQNGFSLSINGQVILVNGNLVQFNLDQQLDRYDLLTQEVQHQIQFLAEVEHMDFDHLQTVLDEMKVLQQVIRTTI